MTSFRFKSQSTADHYLGVEVREGAEKQVILWDLVVGIVPYYMFHKLFELLFVGGDYIFNFYLFEASTIPDTH